MTHYTVPRTTSSPPLPSLLRPHRVGGLPHASGAQSASVCGQSAHPAPLGSLSSFAGADADWSRSNRPVRRQRSASTVNSRRGQYLVGAPDQAKVLPQPFFQQAKDFAEAGIAATDVPRGILRLIRPTAAPPTSALRGVVTARGPQIAGGVRLDQRRSAVFGVTRRTTRGSDVTGTDCAQILLHKKARCRPLPLMPSIWGNVG